MWDSWNKNYEEPQEDTAVPNHWTTKEKNEIQHQ